MYYLGPDLKIQAFKFFSLKEFAQFLFMGSLLALESGWIFLIFV